MCLVTHYWCRLFGTSSGWSVGRQATLTEKGGSIWILGSVLRCPIRSGAHSRPFEVGVVLPLIASEASWVNLPAAYSLSGLIPCRCRGRDGCCRRGLKNGEGWTPHPRLLGPAHCQPPAASQRNGVSVTRALRCLLSAERAWVLQITQRLPTAADCCCLLSLRREASRH